MTSTNRKTYALNLVMRKDDDLIQWLEHIPPGGRNQVLKTVLRCGLELPIPAPETDSIQKLESEVQNMKDVMSRLPTMLKQQPGAVDMTRVDELERIVTNFQEWMSTITQRVESLMQGAPIENLSTIEAAPELTLEDRQQRANKLKKARW